MRYPEHRPKIHEFFDYREFLNSMVDYLLNHTSKYESFRELSIRSGFRSQNFLKMVIEGERNLSEESVEKVIEGIFLSRREALFFKRLVKIDQSKKVEEKVKLCSDLLNSNISGSASDIDPSHLKFLTGLHYITIREMVALPHFSENPSEIARSLVPKLTKTQVDTIINDLLEMGYIDRDNEGRLVSTNKPLTTGDTKLWNKAQMTALASLHQSMARLAVDAVDLFDLSKRDFTGVTAGVSASQYEKIKLLLAETCRDIMEIVNDPDEAGREEDIYRVNLQMFPLTQTKSEDDQ